MPASITQGGSRTPLGNLANYSISKSNIPTNPSDSSGQIPTFSAAITNVSKDAKTHLGDSVVLTDLNDTEFEGVVVAAQKSATSGLLQLDMNTVFERLNTEQTTYPVYGDSTWGNSLAPFAIEQWMLMAGIPKYRVPGNLLHYVSSQLVGYSSRTEATWVQAPPNEWVLNHATSVPTYGPNLGTLDVNRAQSFVMGMPLNDWSAVDYNSEVIINTFLPHLTQFVRYRLMQTGKNLSLAQSIDGAAYTTLASLTIPTDATVSGNGFLYVRVKANATLADRVDIDMKAIGSKTATGTVVVYSSTASSVVSELRRRPELRSLDLGYDPAQAGIDISPYMFFISEGDVLPDDYPKDQVVIEYDAEAKPLTAVPGFTGNVWEKMKELCALTDLDITFTNDQIIISARKLHRVDPYSDDYKPLAPLVKAGMQESSTQREKSRRVEVTYREQPVQNVSAYFSTELWRATSVYSVEKGETKVETIQTNATFLTLQNPKPVSGVPVPYTLPYGTYVVTGHDGYIVDPDWWTDNGGYIKAQPTNKAGEVQLTIQAPGLDTVRAPYRISEGVADRPALYLFGHGLKLEEPKSLKVYTGNPDASEDVGTKLDSIFVTNKLLAFNAGHKLAVTYGSGDSALSFNIPRKENEPQFLGGDIVYEDHTEDPNVYFNGSVYRVEQFSVTPSQVSVSKAPRYNIHRILNGEYATGKTIGQQNAMNAGKKIKDTNLAPLPNYLS